MALYVYVLESMSDPLRHYTGHSTDVAARLAYHNAGRCHHTAKHCPWKLIATIEFVDDARAYRFERYLKSGSGRAFARRHFG
jgi:putative endonuclease